MHKRGLGKDKQPTELEDTPYRGRGEQGGMERSWGGTARGPWMQAKENELSRRSELSVPTWLEREGLR